MVNIIIILTYALYMLCNRLLIVTIKLNEKNIFVLETVTSDKELLLNMCSVYYCKTFKVFCSIKIISMHSNSGIMCSLLL